MCIALNSNIDILNLNKEDKEFIKLNTDITYTFDSTNKTKCIIFKRKYN